MSYIDSALLPSEHIVLKAKVHWYIYIPAIAIIVLGVIFRVYIFTEPDTQSVGFVIIFAGVLKLFNAWLFCYSTELAVTSKRVIAKYGFIRRNTIELKHDKLESLHVEQGIPGRILNFGSVSIIGTGGSKAPIPYIINPIQFKKTALEISEK